MPMSSLITARKFSISGGERYPRLYHSCCATTQRKHQMKRCATFESVFCCRFVVRPVVRRPVNICSPTSPCLSAVVARCSSYALGYSSHLLPTIDQPLLNRRDSLFLLHMLLDLLHGVCGLDVQLDLLACECADSVLRWLVIELVELNTDG